MEQMILQKNSFSYFFLMTCVSLLTSTASQTLLAQTIEPKKNHVIYLYKDEFYAPLELLDFGKEASQKRYYIRNDYAGRYLQKDERQWIITPEYLSAIRQHSRQASALYSIIFLDRSAEFTYYQNPKKASYENWKYRIFKSGLILGTLYFYKQTKSSSKELSSSVRYWNHRSREKRFHRNRRMYYSLAWSTLLFHAYSAWLAWQNYGLDESGRNLQIKSRRLMQDASPILRPKTSDTEENPQSLFFPPRQIQHSTDKTHGTQALSAMVSASYTIRLKW